MRQLSILTGIPYSLLSGPPHYNPDALYKLKDPIHVDNLLSKYAAYMSEIFRLRNRILKVEGFDFFQFSNSVSPVWVRMADEEYARGIRPISTTNTEQDTDEK